MALHATNRFPGDGTTTQYEFNFTGGYLDRSHVKAYIEDASGDRSDIILTDSNFMGDYTLHNLPVVPVGSTLVVYRETPPYYLVDFSNNSRFTEHSLDVVARQGLFKAVEAKEQAEGATGGTATSVTWDNVLGKPYATPTVPGLIKIGDGLSIDGNGLLSATAGSGEPPPHTHTIAEVSGLQDQLNSKQDDLVSGVNIKTINGNSVLGAGDLVVTGGSLGEASGVLAGSYPGPVFAQDMASREQLFAVAQEVYREKSISELNPDGGTTGQVLTRSGTGMIWSTPAAGGSSSTYAVSLGLAASSQNLTASTNNIINFGSGAGYVTQDSSIVSLQSAGDTWWRVETPSGKYRWVEIVVRLGLSAAPAGRISLKIRVNGGAYITLASAYVPTGSSAAEPFVIVGSFTGRVAAGTSDIDILAVPLTAGTWTAVSAGTTGSSNVTGTSIIVSQPTTV